MITVWELVLFILSHMEAPKITISQFLDWQIMFQAINVHVSERLRNHTVIQIFQGPPTCAMIFDGPSHTGASAALPEGEHGCCDLNGQPHVMPLNDALESVNVTPATG